jgi:hypothetical protein
MSIYVHHNPGKIPYNSYLLVFVRSWYMPINPDGSLTEDTWLKVPALKSVAPGGIANYIPSNANIEAISMIIIAEDTGAVTKIARARPNKLLDKQLLSHISEEALDVSDWEKLYDSPWPYSDMVKKELVRTRYTAKFGASSSPYFDVVSTNPNFMKVKRQVGPRPCNCGKGRKR